MVEGMGCRGSFSYRGQEAALVAGCPFIFPNADPGCGAESLRMLLLTRPKNTDFGG